MDPRQLLETSQRLSASLKPADLDETLANITAAAIEVLPDVRYASITVKHGDGRLETFAPTDEMLLDLDSSQYELQEGPCYESATESVHVTAPHLAEDERFPRYAPVAVSVGIEAQAGIRLFDAKDSNGALNLYSEQAGTFENFDDLADLFAHQSATALAYAREISDLKSAVESRQLIGQAVGVVMERFKLDDARAFAFLARLSSHQNIKLRVIAQRLIDEVNKGLDA